MFHYGPIAGIASYKQYVATAGYDNQVILWDGGHHKAISMGLHDHLVNHVAFNSAGSLLVSASSDYTAKVWEVPSMKLVVTLKGHTDDIDMAVFSPNDKLVATCALDRTIRIFDLKGNCLKIFQGHTGNIISLVWGEGGKKLVSSSVDGTIREWDVESCKELRCNNIDGVRTDTLEIDVSGCIYAGDDQGRIVTIDNGSISYTQAHQAGIKKIVLDQEKRILITLSYDRAIGVWKIDQDNKISELSKSEFPALVWARSAALIGDSRVVVGTFGSTYGIYDWDSKKWTMDQVVPDPSINAVALMQGHEYVIGDAGELFCDGEPVKSLGSLCNFLLPVGQTLFTGGQLGSLFNALTGKLIYQHHSPLNCAASFVRNQKQHIVVGSYTGEAIIFCNTEMHNWEKIGVLKIYDNAIKGLVVRGDQIFSVCASTDIAWHRVADFSLIKRINKAHERIANGCSIAGAHGFASIGRDLKLRLWFGNQEEVYQTPHPNSVKCICASEDGDTIVTGAYTGTIAVFDLPSRSWKKFYKATHAGISSIAYNKQSNQFLASSYDGNVYPIQ